MPGFLSRLKVRDGPSRSKSRARQKNTEVSSKPLWDDAWLRKSVEPGEVQELISGCIQELKARSLDTPFLLLPFRPTSDPSAARTFVRQHFKRGLSGEKLTQELRMTEPMVLCSVVKWCWSRLPGGVVGWETYELFKVGELDSNMARYSFTTFIPLSVDSDARCKIIFDFFDLLSAVAAHSRTNGLGGRKLSRLAGWWAFEQSEDGNSFEIGYKKWIAAADATSHLFFAYLRSLSPDPGKGLNGLSGLPMSLQKLIQETEYPPQKSLNLQTTTLKVVMIVDSVSPTPFALLCRSNHFQYRDDDRALRELAEYENPVKALTDECRRVLRAISSTNQSHVSRSKEPSDSTDASWSRFEDFGFSGANDEDEVDDELNIKRRPQGLRTTASTKKTLMGRPATPSWADFLSSGFVDEVSNSPSHLLLPPDLSLPPIEVNDRNSQSRQLNHEGVSLEPGELASISKFKLDDAFWWVWITSLAGEEYPERKAAFGRCALIETIIAGGTWFVMEESVKGAATVPEEGTYIAEKKRFWGRSKKNKDLIMRKSSGKYKNDDSNPKSPAFSTSQNSTFSRTSMGPDPHARIQAAAAQLQQKQKEVSQQNTRRGRIDDITSMKTSSVFTLQPVIMNEATPAMKWANQYDRASTREAYLANPESGRRLESPDEKNKISKSPKVMKSTAGGATPLKESPPPCPLTPDPDKTSWNQNPQTETAENVALPEKDQSQTRHDIPLSTARPSMDQERLNTEAPGSGKSLNNHGTTNGFKRLFVRSKNQPRKANDHPPLAFVAHDPNEGTSERRKRANSIVRRLSGFRKNSLTLSNGGRSLAPSPSPAGQIYKNENSLNVVSPTTPIGTPHDPIHSPAASAHYSLSPVNTNEAQEAQKAFSSFDQGPIEDVPAVLVAKDDKHTETDDAIPPPPPISRNLSNEGKESPKSPELDRWAQIRKNAAERAVQRQQNGENPVISDGENDEASGKESIESRVARIKARVAQLTENMEGPASRAIAARASLTNQQASS